MNIDLDPVDVMDLMEILHLASTMNVDYKVNAKTKNKKIEFQTNVEICERLIEKLEDQINKY